MSFVALLLRYRIQVSIQGLLSAALHVQTKSTTNMYAVYKTSTKQIERDDRTTHRDDRTTG